MLPSRAKDQVPTRGVTNCWRWRATSALSPASAFDPTTTTEMYELYYYPSNATLAPHFGLEEIGAPFVLRLVERERNAQKDPEYMKRNPMGRIPTFVDGDLVLFEAAAICLHLADRHPEARLVPDVGS